MIDNETTRRKSIACSHVGFFFKIKIGKIITCLSFTKIEFDGRKFQLSQKVTVFAVIEVGDILLVEAFLEFPDLPEVPWTRKAFAPYSLRQERGLGCCCFDIIFSDMFPNCELWHCISSGWIMQQTAQTYHLIFVPPSWRFLRQLDGWIGVDGAQVETDFSFVALVPESAPPRHGRTVDQRRGWLALLLLASVILFSLMILGLHVFFKINRIGNSC